MNPFVSSTPLFSLFNPFATPPPAEIEELTEQELLITDPPTNPDLQTNKKEITKIKSDLDETRINILYGIEHAIYQNYRLENLQEKVEQINQDSQKFKQRAKALKRKNWWGKYKVPIIVSSSTATTIGALILLL